MLMMLLEVSLCTTEDLRQCVISQKFPVSLSCLIGGTSHTYSYADEESIIVYLDRKEVYVQSC